MTARTIVSFIRDCRQKGKTVIVSTHVMSEAEKLCDRIGIIGPRTPAGDGSWRNWDAIRRDRFGGLFVRVVEAAMNGAPSGLFMARNCAIPCATGARSFP